MYLCSQWLVQCHYLENFLVQVPNRNGCCIFHWTSCRMFSHQRCSSLVKDNIKITYSYWLLRETCLGLYLNFKKYQYSLKLSFPIRYAMASVLPAVNKFVECKVPWRIAPFLQRPPRSKNILTILNCSWLLIVKAQISTISYRVSSEASTTWKIYSQSIICNRFYSLLPPVPS